MYSGFMCRSRDAKWSAALPCILLLSACPAASVTPDAGDGTCQSCVAAQCARESKACESAECVPFFDCLRHCSLLDTACWSACPGGHPVKDDAVRFALCVRRACDEPCAVPAMADIPPGASCRADTDCHTGAVCKWGRCASPLACNSWGACRAAADCCQELVCVTGRCTTDSCTRDADCRPGLVCGRPWNNGAESCCIADGAACRRDTDCCQGICDDGSCSLCGRVGEACMGNGCCQNHGCIHGICCGGTGIACTAPADCCMLACNNGICD